MKYVFVGGLHRSGTSLVADLLASLPRASGLTDTGVREDEGQHIQDVVEPARNHGGPGLFALDPTSAIGTVNDTSTVDEYRGRFLDAWSPYWDEAASIRVEKSPPNVVRFRFLQSIFPGAICVAVVRHPVPVSMATRKWTTARFGVLLDHWVAAHMALVRDLPYLTNAFIVRYEDLVRDPATVLNAVVQELHGSGQVDASIAKGDMNEPYMKRWHSRRWYLRPRSVHECAAYQFGYSFDLAEPVHRPWTLERVGSLPAGRGRA